MQVITNVQQPADPGVRGRQGWARVFNFLPGPGSLRAQLLLWLLIPLLGNLAFNAWAAYRNAVLTATAVQDRLLLGSARIIGEQVRFDETLIVDIPPAALELFESGEHDRVYYRITSTDNHLLAGYPDVPPPPAPVPSEGSLFFQTLVRAQPVRIVAFSQPVLSSPDHRIVIIEVAQTMLAHASLTRQIWVDAVRQQILLLVFAIVLVLLGLRRGLAPVLELRDLVLQRKPGALQPVSDKVVASELAPLVDALNDYVRRLDEHMSAQGRFIANASHQLRTPLTLLNTQVNFALRSNDPDVRIEALHAIDVGVRQAIRLVNQLLMLSTAEVGIGHPLKQTSVSLTETVKQVLEEQASIAQRRNIDLGFEQEDYPPAILATQPMLHELVANLIDNALRYTPPGGIVTARVRNPGAQVILVVEDNGPGIPVTERERVFERFYRVNVDGPDGCGLGLSIVREIALASAASIELGETPGGGLRVSVYFPAISVGSFLPQDRQSS